MAEVKVHVYDLSQGMANQMSSSILGVHLEGIWHTGIEVFNKEYYFGGGIMCDDANRTPYGKPVEVISLGVTKVTKELFLEFLQGIQPRYTAASYHLLKHNCNTFSNEVAKFLTDKSIPEYITDLPNKFLASPMGQQLWPMLEGLQQQVMQGSSNHLFSETTTTTSSSSSGTSDAGVANANFVIAKDDYEAQGALLHAPKDALLVVDFTASWCGPCQRISPFFQTLAKSYQKVFFLKVDVDKCKSTAQFYKVSAMPTFMFYMGGEELDRLQGANQQQLETKVQFWSNLKPKTNNQTNLTILSETSFKLFESVNVDGMLKKVIENVNECTTLQLSEDQKSTLNTLETALKSKTEQTCHFELAKYLCETLPVHLSFPVLDLIRYVVLRPNGNKYFSSPFLVTLLKKYLSTDSPDNLPKQVPLLCVRIACNILSGKNGQDFISKKEILASVIHSACVGCHSSDKQLKRASCLLLYNISSLLPNDVSDFVVEALGCLIQQCTFASELDNDSLFRVLAGLGKIMLNNKEAIGVAKNFDFEPNSLSKHEDARINDVLKEIKSIM